MNFYPVSFFYHPMMESIIFLHMGSTYYSCQHHFDNIWSGLIPVIYHSRSFVVFANGAFVYFCGKLKKGNISLSLLNGPEIVH